MSELKDATNGAGTLLTRETTNEQAIHQTYQPRLTEARRGAEERNLKPRVFDFTDTTIEVNGRPMRVTFRDLTKPLD